MTSSSSSSGGCLRTALTLFLLGCGGAVVIGIAQWNFGAAAFIAFLILALWVGNSIAKRRKARKLAEQQQLAAYYADQENRRLWYQGYERHQELQKAEYERQVGLQMAEQERQRAALERVRQERWAYLCSRYGEKVAQKILAGNLWLGCPVDAMTEILGPASDIDEKVMKTKTKHTYKYRWMGANRYGLRVFVTNDEVTGWEDKD